MGLMVGEGMDPGSFDRTAREASIGASSFPGFLKQVLDPERQTNMDGWAEGCSIRCIPCIHI